MFVYCDLRHERKIMSEIASVKSPHPIVYCTVYSMYSNVYCDLSHERKIMSEIALVKSMEE